MSQEVRKEQLGRKDISQMAANDPERKSSEGFEGMNYEQIRQPYAAKHKGRNSLFDQRNIKRPDAA